MRARQGQGQAMPWTDGSRTWYVTHGPLLTRTGIEARGDSRRLPATHTRIHTHRRSVMDDLECARKSSSRPAAKGKCNRVCVFSYIHVYISICAYVANLAWNPYIIRTMRDFYLSHPLPYVHVLDEHNFSEKLPVTPTCPYLGGLLQCKPLNPPRLLNKFYNKSQLNDRKPEAVKEGHHS